MFAPKSAVAYDFALQLRTSLNREFVIPCRGQVLLVCSGMLR